MPRRLGKVTADAAPLLELDEAAPVAVALWSPLDVFVACADSLSAEAVTPVLLKHSPAGSRVAFEVKTISAH